MMVMLAWIMSNLKLIVSGILVIISVVVFILRKKSVLIDNSASYFLVSLICEAEKKFGSGHGKDKLNYVIDKYLETSHIPQSQRQWIYSVLKEII